ncbi:methyl-accepting chemotaxis protein [Acidovorax sp. NCPPB 3576]|uniref:methyl-accepting chemotaxis protein n=1 Tax=Acidovorax sp. NCPPB 3576 TaxID=2940488 RepID=UPI00234B9A2D|nr:methyl-accepting chemotaxis protein [Acidovorax sp. NCPPB 3576]WCM88666.1 methyl-accepting chemotaxis protein [Acidovorax sp. NCPPB 3576]
MNLHNLRIGAKLALAFSVTTLITVALAWMAWAQMLRINASAEDLATNWLPSIEAIANVRIAANRLRRTESETFLPANQGGQDKLKEELKVRRQQLAEAEAAYAPLINPGEERKGYEAYQTQRDQYLAVQRRMLDQPLQAHDETLRIFFTDSEKSFDAMAATLGELARVNRRGGDAAHDDAVATFQRAQGTLLAMLLAAVAIASALAWWITRHITRPLASAVAVARGVAAGDLTMDIAVHGKDESAQLMQSLSDMRASLASVVGAVHGGAEGVAAASSQIEQGNQDLSARTEQQASALEETAASMEELSSTVRQNADGAQKASQLATDASTVAQRSGDAVEVMVETMKSIDAASQRIADIIGVVDGIAFQTNILALNAAVEAARAGEQGRGFAVVASEVRTLAQRSADAAKEIKGLIATSVERVGEGSAQANRAGDTMKEVVQSIQRVATIVAEMSIATREQSEGIGQVGEAVAQMDQVTQQNAALVEESAAAASSLKSQAEQLVDAVSVFKIHAAPTAVVAPSAPARGRPAPRSSGRIASRGHAPLPA